MSRAWTAHHFRLYGTDRLTNGLECPTAPPLQFLPSRIRSTEAHRSVSNRAIAKDIDFILLLNLFFLVASLRSMHRNTRYISKMLCPHRHGPPAPKISALFPPPIYCSADERFPFILFCGHTGVLSNANQNKGIRAWLCKTVNVRDRNTNQYLRKFYCC